MKVRIFIVALLFVTAIQAQKKKNTDKAPKSIDSLTQKMSQSKGLITTYLDEENKLYFEIDSTLLGKDLLVVTRIAQLPANYSPYTNAGSKTAQQVIRFIKKGKKIIWKQVSFSNVASVEDPISLSVAENNFAFIHGCKLIITRFFLSNPRLGMLIRTFDKMNQEKNGGGGGGAPQVPSANQGPFMPSANEPTYEWAGAGSGTADTGPRARDARANSGSGGGGSGNGYTAASQYAGDGGSGLVLIAYPT